jgi:hypothetical protein
MELLSTHLFVIIITFVLHLFFALFQFQIFQSKLKKPHSSFLSRKNEYRPFEDAHEIEKMCKKYDTSLFGFGTHNKKRPHNVVLGKSIHSIYSGFHIIIYGFVNFLCCLIDFH